MSHFKFWILAFSINFCPNKIDLSDNSVFPPASVFQKLGKLIILGDFQTTCRKKSQVAQFEDDSNVVTNFYRAMLLPIYGTA